MIGAYRIAAAPLGSIPAAPGPPAPPATLTSAWTTASGPAPVTFVDATNPVTTASFITAGSYTLRLTATDGDLSTQDELTVTVDAAPGNTAPVVDAGLDQIITLGDGAALVATVTDDGLP